MAQEVHGRAHRIMFARPRQMADCRRRGAPHAGIVLSAQEHGGRCIHHRRKHHRQLHGVRRHEVKRMHANWGRPVSSNSSRRAAAAGCSPGSMRPCTTSHAPVHRTPAARRSVSTRHRSRRPRGAGANTTTSTTPTATWTPDNAGDTRGRADRVIINATHSLAPQRARRRTSL